MGFYSLLPRVYSLGIYFFLTLDFNQTCAQSVLTRHGGRGHFNQTLCSSQYCKLNRVIHVTYLYFPHPICNMPGYNLLFTPLNIPQFTSQIIILYYCKLSSTHHNSLLRFISPPHHHLHLGKCTILSIISTANQSQHNTANTALNAWRWTVCAPHYVIQGRHRCDALLIMVAGGAHYYY